MGEKHVLNFAWKITFSFAFFSDCSIQVVNTSNKPLGLSKEWTPLLNGGYRVIEAKITVIMEKKSWDFEMWPINSRRLLNKELLNTGSTGIFFIKPGSIKWLYQWFVVFFAQESLWAVSEEDLGNGDQPDAYAWGSSFCDNVCITLEPTPDSCTHSVNTLSDHLKLKSLMHFP